MSTRLPRLAVEQPAALELARYEAQHFIEYVLVRPKAALQRSAISVSSLMNHWFNSMIGFGRAAQIQKGNENVV